MKLHLDSGENLLRISAYDGSSVTVSERSLTETFALTPTTLIGPVAIERIETLTWGSLPQLQEHDIEILVLGTGPVQVFPGGAFYAELAAARIGLEVMDSGAACRTYNILAAEGRRVAAVIVLENRGG